MTFEQLSLAEPLLRSLQAEGYQHPTPIQQKAIPVILEGNDLIGCAQTGTGKTAAFALPTLQHLYEKKQQGLSKPNTIKALVLTPTRELAVQVDESFRTYGRFTGMRTAVVYGGVSQYSQEMAIRRGADILIATPGRLLDLVNQRIVNLSKVEVLILDEADRMLDMGFINDINRIISMIPENRQTLFFSATMAAEIRSLADRILTNPVKVEVATVSSTADTVEQKVCYVHKGDKRDLLKHLLEDKQVRRVLVFTRTKHGADKVTKDLNQSGIKADAIHGNKTQNARQQALNRFRSGNVRVLVATDVAARGIDVDNISHVINYELPNEPETYVHRIGRTGRAGTSGIALSFCDAEERNYLASIQKLIKKPLPVNEDHPYVASDMKPVMMYADDKRAPKPQGARPQSGKRPAGRSGYWRNKRSLSGRPTARNAQ